MIQTVNGEKPLEERVHQASKFGGGFHLEKGRYNLPLPGLFAIGEFPDKSPHMSMASKLDEALNRYYNLLGGEYLFLKSEGSIIGSEVVSISYLNKTFRQILWAIQQTSPKMGIIKYTKNNELSINIRGPFGNMANGLLGGKVRLILKEKEFHSLIDDIENAIDTLFTTEGIEPTATIRRNLLSLTLDLPKHILENSQAQSLLGTNTETNTIDNPSLIQLAGKGVTSSFIKIFHRSGFYPENIEEMLELVDIPFEMLDSIWNNKR